MAGLVLDSSAALPWCFGDEATKWTEALLDRVTSRDSAIVPAHWPIEVANALLTSQRRGRVTAAKVQVFCEDLAELAIQVEAAYAPMELPAIITLAHKHGLTIYDAAYLELSRRLGLPLATLDQRLQNCGVEGRPAAFSVAKS